eukprot:gene13241-19077_t
MAKFSLTESTGQPGVGRVGGGEEAQMTKLSLTESTGQPGVSRVRGGEEAQIAQSWLALGEPQVRRVRGRFYEIVPSSDQAVGARGDLLEVPSLVTEEGGLKTERVPELMRGEKGLQMAMLPAELQATDYVPDGSAPVVSQPPSLLSLPLTRNTLHHHGLSEADAAADLSAKGHVGYEWLRPDEMSGHSKTSLLDIGSPRSTFGIQGASAHMSSPADLTPHHLAPSGHATLHLHSSTGSGVHSVSSSVRNMFPVSQSLLAAFTAAKSALEGQQQQRQQHIQGHQQQRSTSITPLSPSAPIQADVRVGSAPLPATTSPAQATPLGPKPTRWNSKPTHSHPYPFFGSVAMTPKTSAVHRSFSAPKFPVLLCTQMSSTPVQQHSSTLAASAALLSSGTPHARAAGKLGSSAESTKSR